jgi:gas vesicle protein
VRKIKSVAGKTKFLNSAFWQGFGIYNAGFEHLKPSYMSLQRLFTATLSGIVIGILIAPAKGTDTRKKLSDSVDNIKDKIRRIRGTTNEELEELHEVFEHEISGLRDDIREKVLKLIEVSKKGYNHVRSEALS